MCASSTIHQRSFMHLHDTADEAPPQVTRESRSAVGLEAIQYQTCAPRCPFPGILPGFAGGPDGGGDAASVRPPPPVHALGPALLAAEPERPSRPWKARELLTNLALLRVLVTFFISSDFKCTTRGKCFFI